MANYETLKTGIQQVIKENGNREITGEIMQQTLLAMVNSLGCVGYQFAGIATPTTNPGTPDQRVFYLASTPGIYTYFGRTIVKANEVAIFKFDSEWKKTATGLATLAQLNDVDFRTTYCGIDSFLPMVNGEQKAGIQVAPNEILFCIKKKNSEDILAFVGLTKDGYINIKAKNGGVISVLSEIVFSDNVTLDGHTYASELEVYGVGDIKDKFDEIDTKLGDVTKTENGLEFDSTIEVTPGHDIVINTGYGKISLTTINSIISVLRSVSELGLVVADNLVVNGGLRIQTNWTGQEINVGDKMAEFERRIKALEGN